MDTTDPTCPKIDWLRIPIPPDELNRLNQRSNFRGFLQAGGFLAVYATTASLAIYSFAHWAWWQTALLAFLHATIRAFLLNGFHELCHNTVFRTRGLNTLFLRIYSFLGFMNYVHFQESHRRHHKYTLHPPGDLEVTLPITHSIKGFFKFEFFNPRALINSPKDIIKTALGQSSGEWVDRILPPSPTPSHHARRRAGEVAGALASESQSAPTPAASPARSASRRDEYIRWARILLVGHGLIILVSLSLGYWIVPLLLTFANSYGTWLRFLCNETQHVGLRNNTPDFRLCCRTITLNPLLQFLYWHMNYHIEHHMYAGIPCYNLPRLHRLIKDQLPPPTRGLIATWRQIGQCLKRQKLDPSYQYTAPLPPVGTGVSNQVSFANGPTAPAPTLP